MNQFLSVLRRANASLATTLDVVVTMLQTRRRAQTVAVVGASCACALVMIVAVARANAARDSWQLTGTVLVTTRWVDAGEPITVDNVGLIEVPGALVADDALGEIPVGATLRVALAPRTFLTESMVAGASQTIDIPDGWRVVAMGVDVTAPALSPGDRVDVVSADQVLASGAFVTSSATDSQGPSVAVPQEVAAVVATAARLGEASLVLAS